MELERFLGLLKSCQDELLKEECGIQDNWPFLLRGRLQDLVLPHFFASSKYDFEGVLKWDHSFQWRFNYVPGTVLVQVLPFVAGSFYPGLEEDKRRYEEHTITITLHPYQKKRMDGISDLRAIAFVIEELAAFAVHKKIPFCLPKSIGSGHKGDFSRMVSFNPCTEIYSPPQECI